MKSASKISHLLIIVSVGLLIILSSCKSTYIYDCNCFNPKFKILIDYYPKQKPNIPDEVYESTTDLLRDIYSDYKLKRAKPDLKREFSTAIPWNLAVMYAKLDEPKEKILCLLAMIEMENLESIVTYFKNFREHENIFNLNVYEIDSLIERYEPYFDQLPEAEISTMGSKIWQKDTLDQALINYLKKLVKEDQKFRSSGKNFYMQNMQHQNEIDSINLVKVDSLFGIYGSYIGRSLVGESTEYAMWAVIQHAPLERQIQYLPFVQKAVEDFELKDGPFKMLIDRIYTRKHGYQIFGSQGGVELGSDRQIKKAKKKFKLD